MNMITKKLRSRARRVSFWVLQKTAFLWFSKWRYILALPVMRSAAFALVSGFGKPGRPNLFQVLFQRLMVAALRHPETMTTLFKMSLRVCVTYRCNLSCKACYARGLQEEAGKTDMRLEDFERLLEYCREVKWSRMRFLGGEPTVHPRFTEMLELCYARGIEISMPSNNLYSAEVAAKLDPRFVKDISINYSSVFGTDEAGRERFRKNLDDLRRRRVPFSFSYILDAEATEDQLRALYADLKEYLPLYLRVSLEMPAFSDHHSAFLPSEASKFLFSRIRRLLEDCARVCVPFYIYRPVPLCLFTPEERRQIEHYSPRIFYTRCPLSCITEGGGGMMVTVNPDLSTYPCASVFIKGPGILTFKDRKSMIRYFSAELDQLMTAPLTEACKTCGYHERFRSAVTLKEGPVPTKLDNKEVCQGGCLNLRCHDSSGHECHQE